MFDCIWRANELRRKGKPVLDGVAAINGRIALQNVSQKAQSAFKTLHAAIYDTDGLISIRGDLGNLDGLSIDDVEAILEEIADNRVME